MTVIDIFPKQDPFHGMRTLLRRWIGQRATSPAQEVEDTRARLDFILEMMDAYPEAFLSDEAFRCSSRHFSGRL